MKKVITTTVLSILSVAIIFLASSFDAKAESRYPTSCTLTKKNATDVLIKFNNANHANPGLDYGLASHKRIPGSWYDYLWQWASVPSGNYRIVVQAADGYVGRSSTTGQTNERFNIELYDQNSALVQKTGYTGDISDGVENGFWMGPVGNVSLNRNVTSIVLRHVVPYENSNPNSVVPVCMLLEDITPAPPVTPPTPVNGQCSSTYNGQYLDLKPTSNLCTVGSASAVSGSGSTSSPWSWTCGGSNGGSIASCKAYLKTTPVNGECNSQYNGQVLTEKPTTNLCTEGSASVVSGTGEQSNPWTWTCDGVDGGNNSTCTATKEIQLISPSIQIIKDDNDNKDDTQTINQGETATFSIKVINNGNVDLTNVIVTDQLSPNCNKTIGDLAVGETQTYTCTIDNVTNSFTNIAVVTGTGNSTNVTDEDDSDVVVEEPQSLASINIDKNDNGNKDDTQVVDENGTATFVITVTNDGEERLTNIFITDDLAPNCARSNDDNVALIEAKYGAGHIYLDPNESFSYTCTDENIQNDYTNIAVVTGTATSGDVTDEDDSDVIIGTSCEPEIRIIKDDNDNHDDTQTVDQGGIATFLIEVSNRGTERLTNIVVTDDLAPNCAKTASEVVALIEAKYGAGHDYLNPWESFSYTCTDDGVNSSYTNIAVVTGTATSGDVTDEDPSDVVVVIPNNNPSIEIIKDDNDNKDDTQTINQGETATFSIKVINNGNVDLTNVIVTDQLSPNCNKTIGDLAVGETQTYTCTIDNVTNSFTNIAVVTGTGNSTNVTDEDDSDVVVVIPNNNPSIEIIKDDNDNKDDTQTINEGKTATFSIKVTNNGNVDLTNVIVTDQLSPNCNKTIGNLAVGETQTYTCTIDNVTNSFTNIAVVTGTATSGDVTDEDPSDVVVTEAPNPAITIVKDDDDTGNHDDTQTVNYGETATFNIYVKNTGNVNLTDISVNDNIVADCSLTTSEATDLINQKYGRGYLEPGESFHYECTDSNVTQGYTNTATATGTGGGTNVDDTDTSDVVVDCNCTTTDVNIVKEARDGGDSQTIDEGEDAHFKITVENRGTARLNEVLVNDSKVSDCNLTTSEAAGLIEDKYGHTYLDPNESFSYECTDEDVEESYTNVAIVTAESENGTDQDSDSTDINVDNNDVCNGSIGDFVWNDINKDGVQDSNEEGISGVKLKLYNGNDVEKDYTSSQGYYDFNNLCEGEYDVVVAIETLPEGCYQTYDRDGNLDHSTTINLNSGEKHSEADFGYYCPTNSVVTTGTTSPTTGAGALAGGAATVFASGAAWLAQRRVAIKAASETLIKFAK